MRRSDRTRPLGIRTKIFAFFVLFTVIALALLWLFQILLLPGFYTGITRRAISHGAEQILTAADQNTMQAYVERVSLAHNAGVRVFVVEGTRVTTVISTNATLGSVVHILSNKQLNEIYDRAEASEDGAWARYRLLEGDYRFAWEEKPEGARGDKVIDERWVYATLGTAADGRTYFILLDVPRQPIDGMVTVLGGQLIVLSFVLLLVSAVLAGLISRRISMPIACLTEAARRLPCGTYPQEYREDAYREVAELSETLAEAAEEIGKTDALQKELIANVSHDLRTPLTMIIGYAEMMRDIEGESTPENMQVIIDEAGRLSDMVGDLVAISRYQAGAERVVTEEFSLSDEAVALLDEYRTLLSKDGFLFEGDVEDGIRVTADKKRIVQVIRNLLDNAVNYGGEAKSVKLSVRRTDGAVRVDVRDHGPGIPEAELKNIWQRYYRASGNHPRSKSGSGLGLSIVRENLELHNARYGVESRVEGESGTVFWFELPSQA